VKAVSSKGIISSLSTLSIGYSSAPTLHKDETWPPDGVWEWVYNGADIDDQKVVWAQDMGPAENEELIRYYKHRDVWLLEADDQPPKLDPYVDPAGGAAPPSKEKMAAELQQSVRS